jgi:ribose/xylose/arabinose/galactoside ABC-type transport system permease subunit
MKLYFSASQIPELRALTRHQRKAVFQCAMEAFYHDDPSRVWIGTRWFMAGILCGTLAGALAVALLGLLRSPVLIITLGGLAGAAAGILIATQSNTAQLRPYLRRVIEHRRDEISKIS